MVRSAPVGRVLSSEVRVEIPFSKGLQSFLRKGSYQAGTLIHHHRDQE